MASLPVLYNFLTAPRKDILAGFFCFFGKHLKGM